MTFHYVIDNGIWAQWTFTKDNYKSVLPASMHDGARGVIFNKSRGGVYFARKSV